MNSQNGSNLEAKLSKTGICLTIQGLGHVPSFKNSKCIYRTKKGQPFIATNPKNKKFMELCTLAIELQLNSLSQTIGGEISTEQVQQSLIVWSKEFDDSRQWIPEIHVKMKKVSKGMEGAIIIIEKI